MRRREPQQSWDGAPDDKVRVLLECDASWSPSIVAPVVERHGYSVRVCEGPGPKRTCDLLESGTCELLEGSDVVVNMLREPELGARVRDEVAATGRPLAVMAKHGDADLPEGATPLNGPVTTEALIGAIRRALEDASEPALASHRRCG